MMKQLKPCPFCGSKNVYMAHIGGRTVGIVCCPDCNLDCTITRRNASAEEITDKWNRRQRQSERQVTDSRRRRIEAGRDIVAQPEYAELAKERISEVAE